MLYYLSSFHQISEMLFTLRLSGEAKHLGFPCVTSEIFTSSKVFVSSKTLISMPVWLTPVWLMCTPNEFFLFPSCLNPFPLHHWLPVSASLSGPACGTGSISENNTTKILNVSLPKDLSLLFRASSLCFHTLLLLAWILWTTAFFAESPSSQCRCPVRLLPLHLMGNVPTDGQMPQTQLAVCLVKLSDTPACFFIVFKPVCYKEDP